MEELKKLLNCFAENFTEIIRSGGVVTYEESPWFQKLLKEILEKGGNQEMIDKTEDEIIREFYFIRKRTQ